MTQLTERLDRFEHRLREIDAELVVGAVILVGGLSYQRMARQPRISG